MGGPPSQRQDDSLIKTLLIAIQRHTLMGCSLRIKLHMSAHVLAHVLEPAVCQPGTILPIRLHFPPPHAVLRSVRHLATSAVALAIGKPRNGGERLVLCFWEPHSSHGEKCNWSKNMLPKGRTVQQMGILIRSVDIAAKEGVYQFMLHLIGPCGE